MKYIIFIITSIFILISCNTETVKPIDVYKGQNLVIVSERMSFWNGDATFRVKNKDSVFVIKVPAYDVLNLKQGDTIK